MKMETSQYPSSAGYKKMGTSQRAAKEVNRFSKSIKVRALQVLKNKKNYGATADEVANLLSISILSVRPRFSELLAQGCIEETDRTRKNESGKQATVWRYLKDV